MMQGFERYFFSLTAVCAGGLVVLLLIPEVFGQGGKDPFPSFPLPTQLAMTADLPPLTAPGTTSPPTSPATSPKTVPTPPPTVSQTKGTPAGSPRTPFPSSVEGRPAAPPTSPGKIGGFKAATPQNKQDNKNGKTSSVPKTSPPLTNGKSQKNRSSSPHVQTTPVRKEMTKEILVPENNIFTPLVRIPNTSLSRIVGISCHLNDFIAPQTSTLNRHNRIVDWWSLTEKLAIYNVWLIHAQDVQLCIDRYPKNAVPQSILPLLVSMQQSASQHLKAAEIDFIESQFILCNKYPELRFNLMQAVGITDPEKRKAFFASRLPIPVDVPTTAVYNTRINEIARIRALSTKARNLSLTIPLQYDTVQARIEQYNQAYAGLQALFKKQGTPDDLLFQALDRSTRSRVEMVHAIIEYNQMISSYVAQTVARYVKGSRFLATLNQRSQTVPVNKNTGLDREETILPVNYEMKSIPEVRKLPENDPPKTFSTEPMIFPAEPTQAPPPLLSDPKPEKIDSSLPVSAPIIRGQVPSGSPERNKPLDPARGSVSSGNGIVSIPIEQFSTIKAMMQILYVVNPNQTGAGNSPILEIPLSLKDAIGNTSDSMRRLEIVDLYWELRTLLAELEIEKGIFLSLQTTGSSLEQQLRQQGSNPDQNFAALVSCWRSTTAESNARKTDLQIKIRNTQISLMEKLGRTTENGWPIPISFPYCGPSYRLEIGNARQDSFVLLAQCVLIPEKLQAIQAMSKEMGRPETLFRPEIASLNQVSDCWIYLKILENKRSAALSFVKMIDSLNRSIALYVSNYSDSIPNDAFVKSLIGSY